MTYPRIYLPFGWIAFSFHNINIWNMLAMIKDIEIKSNNEFVDQLKNY